MSVARSTRAVLVVCVALVVATCSSGPSAGELVVDLATALGDTQAVQFTITAAESKMVETVTPACSGCQVFTVRVADGDLRGVVSGSIQPGPLLRVVVSDVDAVEAYSAQVTDAANAAFVLLSAADYSLELRKP